MIKQTHLTRRNILILVALILIVVDLLIYILALNDYYLIFSSMLSVNMVVFIIHFICVYVFPIVVSKIKASKVFWGIVGPFFLVPVAIVGWFLFFYDNNPDYYYLSSPNSTQTLIIKHSNWSLGETNHYYDFYQSTAFPMMKKKINKETLHIMTRYTDATDLDVLGVYKAKWSEEKTVRFKSKYNEITINLY
ncbi:hypothetical protein CN510_16875 [Priestia megaterium]|uniref:hypothetical protein n=1 Tax=Priestia megaterium TaxID=1404 RepID=UPI000BF88CDA|nr:hypothetical protein [Priestia megaterium]PES94720.1 hypothetical protein CN510_16875 [Priestia megaterium]